MPRRPRAPCRVELPVASEVRASVGSERGVEDDRLSEIVVGGGVERGVAGLAEIFPVQLLHLPYPLVLRPAYFGQGSGACLGVVVVAFCEYRVGVRAPQLRSCQNIDRVKFTEGLVEGEVPSCDVAVPVRPVLGDAPVEVRLRAVVASQPVTEGSVGVLVHDLVGGVVRE